MRTTTHWQQFRSSGTVPEYPINYFRNLEQSEHKYETLASALRLRVTIPSKHVPDFQKRANYFYSTCKEHLKSDGIRTVVIRPSPSFAGGISLRNGWPVVSPLQMAACGRKPLPPRKSSYQQTLSHTYGFRYPACVPIRARIPYSHQPLPLAHPHLPSRTSGTLARQALLRHHIVRSFRSVICNPIPVGGRARRHATSRGSSAAGKGRDG